MDLQYTLPNWVAVTGLVAIDERVGQSISLLQTVDAAVTAFNRFWE